MIQYFAPDIAQTLTLPDEEARHCLRVLRTQAGQCIHVIDGKGHRYTCRVLNTDPRKAVVEIVSKVDVPPVWAAPLTVAVAPTKNIDRIEWLVEKLTEMGIDRIVPLLCRHSERKNVNTDRLERIAISAMKQSLKATLPIIAPLTTIDEFLTTCKSEQKFVGYCADNIERCLLARELRPGLSTALMIGPEGDFSPEEIQQAFNSGFQPISLGEARLRTETAAMAAAQTFHVINML
ncbi:MAG: 16S rRNA (uracil(1498)-N(3))-methyltransferase [Muribaculum sp.]|nr:16S rRNA (uracil(1498)-N(3))-methyltransferase [Muribaculaceae bacterium]MCM1081476.1 16S rRNA (uracil(1498)-N(3))-methyltransferase [Muribaculum sp.]